jgi:dTDP-glucose 4,6-dehydratase
VKTNFEGTAVLLESARKHKKRFHHVSTDEVFGSLELGANTKFTEETPYDPKSPYSASKAASDHLVRAYGHTFGLEFTISNCSNNYGPYHFPEKFIPLAITNLIEGKTIPIYGDGLQVRDWLYVDDHSRAIDLIIHKGRIGETYAIGGLTEDISNIQVARMILALMGKDDSSLEYVKDRPGHDVRYAVDWSKIHRELGFSPEHSFPEHLKSTVEWYKTHQDWWKAVKDGSYEDYYKQNYQALDSTL